MIRRETAGLAALVLLSSTSLSAAEDSLAERGEYISNLAGCHTCHLGEDGTQWKGGTPLATPFGNLLGPNITQDKETGIGNWTRDDFEGALRRGVNEDGDYLYPAMPYTHYTKMTDDDIDALWAYFQTIEPVKFEVESNQLPFPFNIRTALLSWQTLYFEEARFEPDENQDEHWNRGAYLVNALAHCSACHTPRDTLGGPIEEKALTGATLNGWYAPDISNGPDSVIRDWSVEDLAGFLANSEDNNHVALGEMALIVDELREVDPEDVNAIATYLKNRTEDEGTRARKAPFIDPEDQAEGEAIFATNCASCHKEDGEGEPGVAASLVKSGTVIGRSPHNIIRVLLKGIAPNDEYGVMPSFKEQLSDEEIALVANYIRTAWGNEAAPNVNAPMVSQLRPYAEVSDTIELATVCPNPPSDVLNDDFRDRLATLATKRRLDEGAMTTLIDDYTAEFPEVDRGERMLTLTAIYCQNYVKRDDIDRSDVVSAQIDFQNMLVGLDRR
jgi:mono/diheme cytochrome c family protein